MKFVITGGCRGLGKSFTKYALSQGHTVYALYNKSIDEAYELDKMYDNLRAIKCDIRDEEEVDKVLFNIGEFDVLINNASIALDNSYIEKSKKEFMSVLETNLVGTFLMIKYGLDKINKNGIIINISSNNAIGANTPLSMDYDASKAGVNMLTKDFAMVILEEKMDVKVISICPGWINTDSVMEADPKYISDELLRLHQSKLIDKDDLAKYIIDNMGNYKNGEIVEINELESIYGKNRNIKLN